MHAQRGRAALQRPVSPLESSRALAPVVVLVAGKEFFSSPLEPTPSAASYPPLHNTQGRGTLNIGDVCAIKARATRQGQGNPYVGNVGTIKSPGHPPGLWILGP